MGFFDSKWIVEFEYSDSFIGSYKKATMVVEASSEYSAKDKAKSVLKANHKYVKVLSAHKSGGKSEERGTTYKPSYTTTVRETPVVHSEPVTHTVHHESRPLTAEERERMNREAEERRIERERQEKQRKISAKEKEIKKIEFSPIKSLIIALAISFGAFFFGWIPHWVCKSMEKSSRWALEQWIELGHSETDSFGQELVAEINQRQAAANGVLWIPFVILGVGVVITVLVYLNSRKKVPTKLEKAKNELQALKSQEK